MRQLDTSCKGWARLQASLDNEKKKYRDVTIDLNFNKYDTLDFYKIKNEINLNDKRLTPETIESIKNFDTNTGDNNYERYKKRYVITGALTIYISQRLEEYQFTGEKCTDAFNMQNCTSFLVYLEDQTKYSDFMNYVQSIVDDIAKITGNYDIGLKDYEDLTAGIPKNEQLLPELQCDQYGNLFEVGDYVARSGCGSSSTFADIIIGKTEKSLSLIGGSSCHPSSVFVIRKGDGSPVSFSCSGVNIIL